MKEVQVMSLGGIIVALEQDAKEVIARYLEKNKAKLKNNEAADEILEDLEAAIGTHLTEQGYGQKRAASLSAVQAVLHKMGEVEDDTDEKPAPKPGDWRNAFKEPFHLSKTNKVIFGLAGGIAERLGIDAFWLRIGFVLLAFVGHGWIIGMYIVAGLLISIIDDGKPVDAKTISEQVRKTSSLASQRVATGWQRPLRFIDQVVRQVFRYAFGTAASLGLAAGVGALAWTLVTMVGKPYFDLPFVGLDRSTLSYIFVISGLLLLIWVSSLVLFSVMFPKRQKLSKKPLTVLGILLPTLALLGTCMSSGFQMRTTIVDWAGRHPGNRLVEVTKWENGAVYNVCVSPILTCTPQPLDRPIKMIQQTDKDGHTIYIYPPR